MSFDKGFTIAVVAAVAFLAGMLVTDARAQGQPDCRNPMALSVLTARAYEQFGEVPFEIYIANNMYVQIFLDPDDQSWTLATVTPDGTACPRASGEGRVVNPAVISGTDS